ncbi:MAG: hypothetical protein KC416_17580, partial [Myxococcales bacterium]|nr:hypothetical protein [Myxococcales bacterium]
MTLSADQDKRKTTTGASPKKVVHFRAGVPVAVHSNLVQECLGQVLARSGMISGAELEESIQAVRRGEGAQGEILVRMGVLTPDELEEGLADQLRIKLFDPFAWFVGEYRFVSSQDPPDATAPLGMGLYEIVYQGVVHRLPPKRVAARLQGDFDHYVVPDPKVMGRFVRIPINPEAKGTLAFVDGTRRLREILDLGGPKSGPAAQLLYSLFCVEAVRFRVHPEPVGTSGGEGRMPMGGQTDEIRKELTDLRNLLRREEYEKAFGVRAGNAVDVRRVADQLRHRFRPITETGVVPREVRQLAFEVCARIVHGE